MRSAACENISPHLLNLTSNVNRRVCLRRSVTAVAFASFDHEADRWAIKRRRRSRQKPTCARCSRRLFSTRPAPLSLSQSTMRYLNRWQAKRWRRSEWARSSEPAHPRLATRERQARQRKGEPFGLSETMGRCAARRGDRSRSQSKPEIAGLAASPASTGMMSSRRRRG